MYYLLIIFLKNKTFPNKIYKFHLQRLKQTPFRWKNKRKPKIWDRRKCEDSRFVENAWPAFLFAPTSLFLLSQISGFLLFGSRRKLVFSFEENMGFLQKSMIFIRMNISRRGYFLTWLYKNYIYLFLSYVEFFSG